MKKYFFKSIAVICCLLLQHAVFAQTATCPTPTVTPTGTPLVGGAVVVPCCAHCATLSATTTGMFNTTTYTVGSTAYTPFDYTAGTTPTTTYGGGGLLTGQDDAYSGVIPLPFNFCYFGNTYSAICIGTNGNISFNTTGATSVANANDPWSISGPLPGASTTSLNAIRNCIMGPWHDLYPPTSGTIKYATYGAAPCRQFVVSYYNVQQFISAPAGTECTHQIVLYESSNIIDVYIQKYVPYMGWNGGLAVTAISGNVATAPVTAFYAVPGENGVVFTATNEGWRFTPSAPVIWNYTWTGPTGVVGTGASVVVCPTVNTTYTVTATAATCSSISASATIPVTLSSEGSPITGITDVCTGSTTTLSNACLGGTWTSTNPAVATIDVATGVVSGITAGTTTISYEASSGCFSSTVVHVYQTPDSIMGPLTVCKGATVVLTNTAPGGVWSTSDPTIATVSGFTGEVYGVDSGTAIITYTTGGLCYRTRAITVKATAPIVGTMDMCQYYGTTLSDALAGGVWSSSSTGTATVTSFSALADSASVSGLVGGTATITYTRAGCPVTTVVTVHPKPTHPTITSPSSYCQFEIAVPMAATGTLLKWYGPGVTPPMTIAPTPVTTTPGVTNYYVTWTDVYGCTSDSAIAPVTVKPKPDAPITRDTTYCQYFDHAAPLTADGSNLKWYNASNTLLGSAPVPPTDFVGSTTWFVSQTVDGCASDKAPLTVTIVFKPDFTIAASSLKVCQFDTLVLSYNGPMMVGPGYHWDLPLGASVVRGSVYDSVITVEFDTAWGIHPVYLTASNLNGLCSTTKELDINVISQPSAHSYIKRDICLGDTVLLALSGRSDNASEFTWLIDGTPLATSTGVNIITADWHSGGPFLVSFNTPGNHIIKIQATVDGMCPSKIEPDTLRVHALPNSKFKTLNSYQPLCLEDSIEFQADTIGYNYSYTWAPDHSFHNENKGHIFGRLESERTVIKLTVTDPFGCKSTSSMEFLPETCCTVFVPNAFTPNGDGHDDTYYARFKGDSYHRVHIFRITNRWGQTLFQSTDSDPRWDGTYNGVPQDMGVYFYYIKYDCGGKTMETKGDCTLVR